MNNPLQQTSSPTTTNPQKNDDHIPAEAFEFRFPSRTDKRNRILKRVLIGFVAVCATVIFLSAIVSKNAYLNELEAKIADNLQTSNTKFLDNPQPAPLVFTAEATTELSWKDSPYLTVLKNLAAQRYRYVMLKETEEVGKGKIATGYYDTTNVTDFIGQFHEGQQRVGYITVGPVDQELIYLVIYNPKNIKVQQLLDNVSAPGDEKALAEFDIKNFKKIVVKNITDIEKQIVIPVEVPPPPTVSKDEK